jgi:hypothetical protein
MITLPYIRTDQFIASSFGCEDPGKKHITHTISRNATENRFTAKPYLPRLKRRLSNGSFLHRFTQTQDIDTIYDEMRALTPSEVMLLYAVRLPMLMRDSRVDTINVNTIDLSGMSQPGGTYTR